MVDEDMAFSLATSRTLAMKTWNLKIVDVSGNRAGWGHLLLRYGLACLNLVCLGFGWWGALFRKDRQFLQDHFAGTQLILVSLARSQPSADQATTLP